MSYAKALMIFQLSLYAVISSLSNPGYLVPVAASVLAAVIFDYLHNYLRYDDTSFPDGAVVTALITSGIVFPGQLLPALEATLLALVFKHVFKLSKRNVFNPAALGLYLSSVLFGTGLAWWTSGSLLVPLLGLSIAWLVRMETSSITFLASYWLLGLIFSPPFLAGGPLSILTGNAVFFAFIMVLEPVTSPNTRRGQAVYGLGAGILSFLLGYVSMPLLTIDTFLVSLLAMNLVQRFGPERWFA